MRSNPTLVTINSTDHLDFLQSAFHLLLFSKNNSEEKIKAIRDLVDKHSNVIQIEVISFSRATNDLYELKVPEGHSVEIVTHVQSSTA